MPYKGSGEGLSDVDKSAGDMMYRSNNDCPLRPEQRQHGYWYETYE